jgi:hypothetical protein
VRRSIVFSVSTIVIVIITFGVYLALPSPRYPGLTKKLLSADEMPTTWRSASFQNAIAKTGCLSKALDFTGLRPTAEVSVVYVNEGTLPPDIGEALATFRNSDGAFAKLTASLAACRYINGGNPNATGIYGTVSTLSIPSFGTLSRAFSASVTLSEVPATLSDHLVVVEKGHYVMELFEVNLGSVNDRQFIRYVDRALARI